MLSERESAIHFYWFRNEADSFRSLLKTYQKYVHTNLQDFFSNNWDIFARSGQEWTTVAKK